MHFWLTKMIKRYLIQEPVEYLLQHG